jgi:hypothetical protein
MDKLELRGIFHREHPRFKALAANLRSHNGYQGWHKNLDDRAVEWLEARPNATPEQSLRMMQREYQRPDIRYRFPGYIVPSKP